MFGMSRVVLATVGFLILLGAGSGAAYLYFFSGLRTAPKPLALPTPTAAPATSSRGATPSSPVSDELAGRWTVGPNPEARYRVKEQVVSVGAHEAVASTSEVSGGLTARRDATGPQADSIKFVVRLGNLHSVDQLAGHPVSQRDLYVNDTLAVQQFPEATFEAPAIAVPASIDSGQTVALTVPGRLSIHGTTRDVEAHLQAHMNGKQLEVVGSMQFNMTDFGITPPRVPFATADPQVTIEFQVLLVKSA